MSEEDINEIGPGSAEQALVDLAIESWRFQKLFGRALTKMDAGESSRFSNQHRFYVKRIEECLAEAGFKLVSIEGQLYEAGSAVTALNLKAHQENEWVNLMGNAA